MLWKSWPWRTVIRWLGVIAAAAAAVLVIIALLGPITYLIASNDVSAWPPAQRAAHLQAARETARTQLLTLGAGIFALGALWFTARNFILSREGQVTDRYTKAIDHLGSSRRDVRIGGIYALQRIAYDSGKDHPTVMQVLCTFIREHSHEPWPADKDGNLLGGEQKTRPDVQAALFVIGYRRAKSDNQVMDLNHASLRSAILDGMSFTSRQSRHQWVAKQEPSAWLDEVDFTHATLKGVDLEGASLYGANFTDANLSPNDPDSPHPASAKLTGAKLTGANFTRADLTDADLTGAKLIEAKFIGADLTGANFTRADLTGANFTRADLTDADLTDAKRSKDDALLDDWKSVPDPDSDKYQRLKRRNSGADGSGK